MSSAMINTSSCSPYEQLQHQHPLLLLHGSPLHQPILDVFAACLSDVVCYACCHEMLADFLALECCLIVVHLDMIQS